MRADLKKGHVVIEHVAPSIDCGRYRAKAVAGDRVEVTADIFRDGPALVSAVIRYRGPGEARWAESPMRYVENDLYAGSFRPTEIGIYTYAIEAWTDTWGTWTRDLVKKVDAGQEVSLDLREGAAILDLHLKGIPAKSRGPVKEAIALLQSEAPATAGDERIDAALDPDLLDLVTTYPYRGGSTVSKPVLELRVDRERARFGAWYEFFPRSTGAKGKHGTFKTAATRLPQIAAMGFDVVYLPPIHPIGKVNRKGKNNSLEAKRGDVGSPWAIGSDEGGHTAVHPDLGTIDDFDEFVRAAEQTGLEVALDFAIQCAPDHPWVTEHPDWFHQRPDGTIRYAENPPKKYQDIYPVNFDTPDREGLWNELKGVLDFWIAHGVKIFRVDNPHTKALPFWEWVLGALKEEHPDLIFLSEAFTRPKVMRTLAKLGFEQSYTYFTWRNTKWELTEYLTELTQTEMAHYFRPNFFANTPDILHEYLQMGGPPAFKIRLILAALLSPSYGIYSGYELFENVPAAEGSEEYLNSEKYELRPREFDGDDTLVGFITRVNEIRAKHPALAELTNLRFHDTDKENVLAFSKSADGETILVVVTLNPFHWEEATVVLDLGALGLSHDEPFEVDDLLGDSTFVWHGPHNYVRLDPWHTPAHVFRIGG